MNFLALSEQTKIFAAVFQDSPLSVAEIRDVRRDFWPMVKHLEANNGASVMMDFIEAYMRRFPWEREQLWEMRHICQNEIGSTQLVDRTIRLIAEITEMVAEYGRRMHLPPIVETVPWLKHFGEMVHQTAQTIDRLRLGVIDQRPVLCLPQNFQLSNTAFFPYLSDGFEVVTQPDEINYFTRLAVHSPYNTVFSSFSKNLVSRVTGAELQLHCLLREAGIDPFPLTLKAETEEKALLFLRSSGINESDSFVVMHLREYGYGPNQDASHHESRNAVPVDYEETIDWLLKKGYKITRIGHPMMTEMPARKGFVDLTRIEHPPEVDIYLCAKALFYYGSASGPFALAHDFGTPALLAQMLPYLHVSPNTLVQWRPILDRVTGCLVRVRDIVRKDLGCIFASQPLHRNGLVTARLAPDAYRRSVEEMIELLEGGRIIEDNRDVRGIKAEIGLTDDVMLTRDSIAML